VRCETAAGPPPQKNCDMEQLAQMQGQANPISRVAIPLPPKGETAKLFIQVPINVSFAAPLKIVADAKDAGVSTPFRRCIPAGCFAEVELKDDLQKKFRAAAEPGKMMYKDAGDRDVTIPLSFKGFGQAFEALLMRMFAHPLDEVRSCADQMLSELRQLIPAFLSRVDQPSRGGRSIEYLAATRRVFAEAAAAVLAGLDADARDEVTLTDFDPDGELKVVAAALCAKGREIFDLQITRFFEVVVVGHKIRILLSASGIRKRKRR